MSELANYFPFDAAVIERVGKVAGDLSGLSWPEITSRYRIPETEVFVPKHAKPIEVLDLNPQADNAAWVYHSAMGENITPNLIMHVVPLLIARPDDRIIAVGNAGALGQAYGKLRTIELTGVVRGNLRAAVDPTLEYLSKHRCQQVGQIGYSYGADKAVATAQFAENYDIEVASGIVMEPAVADGVPKLISGFIKSAKHLDRYVEAANCPGYTEAKSLSPNLVAYGLGLLRASNLAIGLALGNADFESRSRQALLSQPAMRLSLLWGGQSEIATDRSLMNIASSLTDDFGPDRLFTTRLPDETHAMCDDIWLHTASILHGMEQSQID